MDVLLSGQEGNSCSGARSHGTANQRTFTATGERPDENSTTGAATDPGPVAFLMVAADSPLGSCANTEVFTVDGDRVESKL